MTLLTYEATVSLADGSTVAITDLLGDGTDATRDHQLPAGAVITSIGLPSPWVDERAAYFRSISRFEAEWPLVECVVRARFDGERSAECAVGLGGVATVPLRMATAEAVLVGEALTDEAFGRAAAVCSDGANPLPETGYKVELLEATVRETLQRLRRH